MKCMSFVYGFSICSSLEFHFPFDMFFFCFLVFSCIEVRFHTVLFCVYAESGGLVVFQIYSPEQAGSSYSGTVPTTPVRPCYNFPLLAYIMTHVA